MSSIVDHVIRGEGDNLGEAGTTLTNLYSNLVRVICFLVTFLEVSLQTSPPGVKFAGNLASVSNGVNGEGIRPQGGLHLEVDLLLAEQGFGEVGEHEWNLLFFWIVDQLTTSIMALEMEPSLGFVDKPEWSKNGQNNSSLNTVRIKSNIYSRYISIFN